MIAVIHSTGASPKSQARAWFELGVRQGSKDIHWLLAGLRVSERRLRDADREILNLRAECADLRTEAAEPLEELVRDPDPWRPPGAPARSVPERPPGPAPAGRRRLRIDRARGPGTPSAEQGEPEDESDRHRHV